MLVFLAIFFAVTTVSAQYGSAPSNNPPTSYSSNPVYYPPAVYDSEYWDYASRERHHKQCPKLTTYVGEFPGIPSEAFYPPVIRYVKYGKKLTALVACDRDVKSINILFARYNSSRDIRSAYFAAFGSTAGLTLTCNRHERRYEGLVVDTSDNQAGGDFSKKVEITQFTCVGLDKTIIGLGAEKLVKGLAVSVADNLSSRNFFESSATGRRKRQAAEQSVNEFSDKEDETVEPTEAPETESTEAPETESTEAPETESTETPETESTEAPETESTEAPETESTEAPETESTEAPETESTEAPETESTDAPNGKTTPAPEVESTEAHVEKVTDAVTEAVAEATEGTTEAAAEGAEAVTEAVAEATEAPTEVVAETTDAVVENTEAPAASVELTTPATNSTGSIQSALEDLGKLLERIF